MRLVVCLIRLSIGTKPFGFPDTLLHSTTELGRHQIFSFLETHEMQSYVPELHHGKVIKAAVAEHPGKSVLVLCGHTHESGIYCDGNVLVLTAGAR